MSRASIGNAVDAGLATMPLPAGSPTSADADPDVAGGPGWVATGEPASPPLVQPAMADATITIPAAPHARIDGLHVGSVAVRS
jgi:hypothetical protein